MPSPLLNNQAFLQPVLSIYRAGPKTRMRISNFELISWEMGVGPWGQFAQSFKILREFRICTILKSQTDKEVYRTIFLRFGQFGSHPSKFNIQFRDYLKPNYLTKADLCFDCDWLPKARLVVSSRIAASPSVIIEKRAHAFSR